MELSARSLAYAINKTARKIGRPVRLMEVCGTHTVAIFRHGIRSLLEGGISLISGPGCPVCVTPAMDIRHAVSMSFMQRVVLATFGDMMRVPAGNRRGGRPNTLYHARALGAEVSAVYSPSDALSMAIENPAKKIVFFATGFETTSPLIAATMKTAYDKGVDNFFVYSSHKLVPPALDALLGSGESDIDGLILPGHVSAIIGSMPYGFLSDKYRIPSVITGFGAEDILEGILMLLRQVETGVPSVEIQYGSVVRERGNPKAMAAIYECFLPADALWRGIGVIPESGLRITDKYRAMDARVIFNLQAGEDSDDEDIPGCACGEVLRGIKTPDECGLFSGECTPDTPVGPCMVSSEGSCAAYYKYGGMKH